MPEAQEEKVEQSVEEFQSAKNGLEESEVVAKEVSNKAESVEDDKEASNENSDNEAEPMEPEVEQVLEAKSEE